MPGLAAKPGSLTQLTDYWLKVAPVTSKREVGQRVNSLKAEIERHVGLAQTRVGNLAKVKNFRVEHAGEIDAARQRAYESLLSRDKIDITLPGIQRPIGVKHPVLRVMDEIVAVFKAMGYSVGEGPEVETDYYNFESLNFPPNHPARDTQDTLFIAGQDSKPSRDRLLLRTHTSPVQIRTMEKQQPPVRIVIPGKVHRNDPLDATHSPVFHQVEGLAVDDQHHLLRFEGHARSRNEIAVRLICEDALLPIVLPFHRTQRRHAGELHLLWRQGLPQVQEQRLD